MSKISHSVNSIYPPISPVGYQCVHVRTATRHPTFHLVKNDLFQSTDSAVRIMAARINAQTHTLVITYRFRVMAIVLQKKKLHNSLSPVVNVILCFLINQFLHVRNEKKFTRNVRDTPGARAFRKSDSVDFPSEVHYNNTVHFIHILYIYLNMHFARFTQ